MLTEGITVASVGSGAPIMTPNGVKFTFLVLHPSQNATGTLQVLVTIACKSRRELYSELGVSRDTSPFYILATTLQAAECFEKNRRCRSLSEHCSSHVVSFVPWSQVVKSNLT